VRIKACSRRGSSRPDTWSWASTSAGRPRSAGRCQLVGEVGVTKQIEPKLTDRHHAGVGLRRLAQHLLGIRHPVLGVQRVHAHRVAQLRKAIGQGLNRWDFRGLNAGVNQAHHPGITPSLGHLLEVRIEIAEHDVAVRINQRSRMGILLLDRV